MTNVELFNLLNLKNKLNAKSNYLTLDNIKENKIDLSPIILKYMKEVREKCDIYAYVYLSILILFLFFAHYLLYKKRKTIYNIFRKNKNICILTTLYFILGLFFVQKLKIVILSVTWVDFFKLRLFTDYDNMWLFCKNLRTNFTNCEFSRNIRISEKW